MNFITHTKEVVSGKRLTKALNKVADKMIENAKAVRKGIYAGHVTEETKEEVLSSSLQLAEKVRNGFFENFTIWQRINTELTNECVALLP